MKAGSAKQVASFISKFDPRIARLLRACRTALRKRLPTAIEQVYDNYNFLAIGYCTTERTSDCVVSLAASAKAVALSFCQGSTRLGLVTLRQLLAAWVVHDLGHIAQVARVMAKQYTRDVGPWVPFLPVLTDHLEPRSS
jgi:hypothetical protein